MGLDGTGLDWILLDGTRLGGSMMEMGEDMDTFIFVHWPINVSKECREQSGLDGVGMDLTGLGWLGLDWDWDCDWDWAGLD